DFHDALWWQDSNLKLRFPELAENFLANLLHGSWPWEDEASLDQYHAQFPESRFFYWKSFTAKMGGLEIYCSPDAWVGNCLVDIEGFLSGRGYWSGDSFNQLEPAEVFNFKGRASLIVSKSNAV